MANHAFDSTQMKTILKEALIETLQERPELLRDVMIEAMEDIGLAEAIRRGQQSDRVDRQDVFDVLEGRS